MFKNKFWLLVGAGLVATSAALGGAGPGIRGVNYDLLCVAIEGADSKHKSALAVLRVEKNGQAQGALCYLSSLLDPELADCHLVAGRVLTAPGAAKASYVGLVGTGIDKDELTQNDLAVKFDATADPGIGSAAQFAVADAARSLTNNTGVGSAVQSRCKYDPVTAELSSRYYIQTPSAIARHPSYTYTVSPTAKNTFIGCTNNMKAQSRVP